MKTLKQKRLFTTREFTLTESELHIKTKTINDYKVFSFKLDTLGQQIYYHSNPPIVKNIIGTVFALIPIIAAYNYFTGDETIDKGTLLINIIIWIPITVIVFLVREKQDIHIIGGQNTVSVFQNIPDKETAELFIHTIINNSKKYIYNKYAKVDPDLPEEQQISTFHWLLTKDIITENEYEQLKHEYKTKKLL